MHDEDIDWVNAASDFGLVALCREMEALTRPLSFAERPKLRTRKIRAAHTPVRASAEVVAILYP
jgi:hypothetical protein